MSTAAAIVLFAAVTFYAIFGGADFGNFLKWNNERYKTLDDVHKKAPIEQHAVQLDPATVFASGVKPPADEKVATPEPPDLRLANGSKALDAGQPLAGYARDQWLGLVLLTATAQLLGHSVFNHLLATVSPMVVSLTILLEIPGASLIAAAWLGQVPEATAFIGLVMILAGMATVVVASPGSDRPEVAPA